ncbi:MAG: class I SAM-dependent methyltransferase [Candidatus Methylomirabilales bacterium]
MKTSKKNNAGGQMLWGSDAIPNMDSVFHSCMGYASTPGWALIQHEVINAFGSFEGLRTIELGCGLGKVSLLFSLLGAKATLLDYNEKQLAAAQFIHEQFHLSPDIVAANLLHLPERLCGQYHVAMSFGTAEHFWDDDRQCVFDSHNKVLSRGGLAIVWVPNRYGFWFRFGRAARKLLQRPVCPVDETPFTRDELYRRARDAGLTDVEIRGGERLSRDFSNFVMDVSRVFGARKQYSGFRDAKRAKDTLRQCMARNCAQIRPWNDLFSYPLVLIGRRR